MPKLSSPGFWRNRNYPAPEFPDPHQGFGTIGAPQGKYMTGTEKKRWRNVLFVLPAFGFVVVFFLIPMLMSFRMSLYTWPLFGENKFLGAGNYLFILKDDQFLRSFIFTLSYTVIITPMIFIIALVLALMVNRSDMELIGVYRTIYFLPVVIGLSTSSLLWIWLLNDRVGIFNALLLSIGLISDPIIWLGQTGLSLLSVIVSVLWKTLGFSMILFLGGLQSIPAELYESAKMDGCTPTQSLLKVTMPLMRRTFAIALLLSIIGSLLAFDQFYIMTGGRPANSTVTSVYWMYISSFQKFKLGYGSGNVAGVSFFITGF